MATKKKAPRTSPLKLLGIVAGIAALIINYYVLGALLPDTYTDPAFGPSILGRSFSGLAIAYNVLFVVFLLLSAYLLVNRQAARATAQRKKRTTTRGAVVGMGESERFAKTQAIYGGSTLLAIVLLIGLFGTATSSPSHAASSTTPTIPLSSTSYSVVALTKSPTGTTRYNDGHKSSKGKLIDTMQAGTTDGQYLYFAYESPAGGGIIAKYDFNGKLINKSRVYKPSEIGHANGIAYNSNIGKLVLATWQPDGNKSYHVNRLAYVDPATLEITSYVNASTSSTISNICYNPASGKYLMNGGIYDSSFKLTSETIYDFTGKAAYGDKKTFGQGIACDANKFYVIRYYASKTKPHTNLYIYDWSGNLTAVYRIRDLKDEAENVFVLNGKLYMGVNNGSTYLGKSSDNRNDYYIRLDNIAL